MILTCPFESCHTVPTFLQLFSNEREERNTPFLQTDFTESIWLHSLNFEIQIPLSILSQFLHLARVVENLCVPATSGGDGDYTH
ncbi:hypothetical protein HanOQP8_Chr16g0621761 [Helianthus annuus]|nr:hypothetical protein HanOQP8_Chr16g0621761 [Helianthus annuus]